VIDKACSLIYKVTGGAWIVESFVRTVRVTWLLDMSLSADWFFKIALVCLCMCMSQRARDRYPAFTGKLTPQQWEDLSADLDDILDAVVTDYAPALLLGMCAPCVWCISHILWVCEPCGAIVQCVF